MLELARAAAAILGRWIMRSLAYGPAGHSDVRLLAARLPRKTTAMNLTGNVTSDVPPAPPAAPQHQDPALVALLKLTAAADRLLPVVRRLPLTDDVRARVDELEAAATASWSVLGPERRMAGGRG